MPQHFLKSSIIATFFLLSWCNAIQADNLAAQKKVAQVLVAEGKVSAYSNESNRHDVSRGSDLFEDEWLEVSAGGRADISVVDGSVVSFIENSKYHFINIEVDPAHPETYKNVASITEGGLKMISGQLSKANPAGYALKTPVATIGIRGTTFSVTLPGKNIMHAFVEEGSITATSSYAAFVSGNNVSKVSKELVTILNTGDAIQATPHTVSNIKANAVFGNNTLTTRTLAPIAPVQTSKPSSSSPSSQKALIPAAAGEQGNSDKKAPAGVKPPESGFCHAI